MVDTRFKGRSSWSDDSPSPTFPYPNTISLLFHSNPYMNLVVRGYNSTLNMRTTEALAVPEEDLRAFWFSPLDNRFVPTFSLGFALLDLSQGVFHRDHSNVLQLH